MSLLPLPRLFSVDGNGAPRANAKLYFYETGTTTPKTVYADSSFATPLTQPVEADSAGVWPAIYGPGEYKVVQTDANGANSKTTDPVAGIVGARPIATLTALRALTTAQAAAYSTVILEGLSSAADGGEGVFVWDADSTATHDGATVVRPASLPSAGRWMRLFVGPVSVKWFGAKGDGSTDDTAAIQAALDTGLPVYFPAGDYRVSSALSITTSGQTITGAGGLTRIEPTSATAHVLDIGDGTNEIRNVSISGLIVWPTATKSAGAAVRMRKAARCTLRDCKFGTFEDYGSDGGRFYDGLYCDTGSTILIDACYFVGGSHDGITTFSTGTTSAEFSVSGNSQIRHWGGKGVNVAGRMGGVKLEAGDISECAYGLHVNDDLGGTNNREVFVGKNFTIDSNVACGVWLDTNSTTFASVAGWVCGTTNGAGIEIQPGQPSGGKIKIDGCIIYGNSGHGVVVNDGNVVVDGCIIHYNGRDETTGGHGVYVTATAEEGVVITGNEITSNGVSGTSPFPPHGSVGSGVRAQGLGASDRVKFLSVNDNFFGNNARYGVQIDQYVDKFRVDGNAFGAGATANTAGAVSNGAGVGVDKRFSNNIGFVTENGGSFTIASGDSYADVTHGMDAVTTIVLTAASQQDGGAYWYVLAAEIGASTFRARLSTAAGADRSFYWEGAYR